VSLEVERAFELAPGQELPPLPEAGDAEPFALQDICGPDLEAAARGAYWRDYAAYGFADWRPYAA